MMRTLIISCSLWDYTNIVMNFLCESRTINGSNPINFDWLQYFDVVITGRYIINCNILHTFLVCFNLSYFFSQLFFKHFFSNQFLLFFVKVFDSSQDLFLEMYIFVSLKHVTEFGVKYRV